ncbi:MAG: copper amine oxidase N-terminal domain-containing protein [Defluviitaleaceae bacterium]|nr:copper amine oxidase N-terminal domain-containing protein [Defluviitaleaceae bacterium]
MKNFKNSRVLRKAGAFIIAAVMMITSAITASGIAIIDEDGNIIQENEHLEGGIMTLAGELDFDFDFEEFPNFPAFGKVTGEVTELWENDFTGGEFVRIRRALEGYYEGQYSYFDFLIDGNSFVMGQAPETGDVITGFFDANVPVTMIYPPQHTAVVIVNRADDLPRVIVDRFDEDWVSSDNLFRLNINDDTEIIFQGGDSFEGDTEELIGRKLVVEFSVSHRDIPETIPNPDKITVLYERAVHPGIEIDWSFGDYEETDWSGYDIVITMDGVSFGVPGANHATVGDSIFPNYVPLRAITEILGFVPEWNAETREITVDGLRGEITFRVDMPYYAVVSPTGAASTYTLDPPIIINDITYVPVRFFRDVFGFNNAWWTGGNISLDNEEIME